MTKMSETRIHRQQILGLVKEGFICCQAQGQGQGQGQSQGQKSKVKTRP